MKYFKHESMTYEDLLISPLLFLPHPQTEVTFKHSLKKLLHKYLHAVEELPDGPLNIEGLDITGAYVKRAQRSFIPGLLETIDIYYEGKPAKAFSQLSKTLSNDQKNFGEVLKKRKYPEHESFYRIREQKGNFPIPSLQMFHIPFELRGIIKTQRYSIPGFPCLYVGRTLYGCWEEMNRPDINEFQAVRLKSIKEVSYLDLTTPEINDQNAKNRDIYHYFMTWPLIACCSIKVKDYSHSFKPEYIIPQLLLQWVRDNHEIDGISFHSTHIDLHGSKSKGDFSNLVLPVKSNQEKGLCPNLMSMFEISDSISWQLREHAIGGQTFTGSFGDHKTGVNLKIQQLELIKGRAFPYSYSILGSLESYLDHMTTYPMESLL